MNFKVAFKRRCCHAQPLNIQPRFGGVRTILVGTDFCRSRSSSTGRTGRWAVTTKAEEYRAKARECEELAEQTRDSFIKEQFLEVAKKWRQMAEHEDHR